MGGRCGESPGGNDKQGVPKRVGFPARVVLTSEREKHKIVLPMPAPEKESENGQD